MPTVAIVDVHGAYGSLKVEVTRITDRLIIARRNGVRIEFGFDGECKSQSVVWHGSKIDPVQLSCLKIPDRQVKHTLMVSIEDETMSVSAWCKRYKAGYAHIMRKINSGKAPEVVISELIDSRKTGALAIPIERTEAARDAEIWSCIQCEWQNQRKYAGSDGVFKCCPKCGGRIVRT